MLSRKEQYTILVPSGEIIGSEPKTWSEVTDEPSGFINSISFFLALPETMVFISGASWLPVTLPLFESTSVMLRMAIIPIEGSERTKTIFSLSALVESPAAFEADDEAESRAACWPKPPGARAIRAARRVETAEVDIGIVPPTRNSSSIQGPGQEKGISPANRATKKPPAGAGG